MWGITGKKPNFDKSDADTDPAPSIALPAAENIASRQRPITLLDIYISYHSSDNIGNKGWVDGLEESIRESLSGNVDIRKTANSNDGQASLSEEAKNDIGRARVFVSVVSRISAEPSAICNKERSLFFKQGYTATDPSTGTTRSRLLILHINKKEGDPTEEELKARCFEFYNDNGYPIPTSDKGFRKKVEKLTNEIQTICKEMDKAAVQEVCHTPEIQEALRKELASSKLTVNEVLAAIDEVVDLKSIHDILHQVRIDCYTPLKLLVKRQEFPERKNSDSEIKEIVEDLEDCLSELNTIRQHETPLINKLKCYHKLRKVNEELKQGLEESDMEYIKNGLSSLERILRRYHSSINTDLVYSFKNLQLCQLVDVLRRVSDQLTNNHTTSNNVVKIQAGADTLEQVSLRLSDLVEKHDRWQQLDDELQAIDACDDDPDELRRVWMDIRTLVTKVFGEDRNDWPDQFRALGDAMENISSQADMPHVLTRLEKFRARSGQDFDKADQQLKKQCVVVQGIARDITQVLPVPVQ
jgi:hypothetical protein